MKNTNVLFLLPYFFFFTRRHPKENEIRKFRFFCKHEAKRSHYYYFFFALRSTDFFLTRSVMATTAFHVECKTRRQKCTSLFTRFATDTLRILNCKWTRGWFSELADLIFPNSVVMRIYSNINNNHRKFMRYYKSEF